MYMPLEKCLVVKESNPTIIQTNIHQPRGVKMMTIVQLRKNLRHDESTLAAIVVFEKGELKCANLNKNFFATT